MLAFLHIVPGLLFRTKKGSPIFKGKCTSRYYKWMSTASFWGKWFLVNVKWMACCMLLMNVRRMHFWESEFWWNGFINGCTTCHLKQFDYIETDKITMRAELAEVFKKLSSDIAKRGHKSKDANKWTNYVYASTMAFMTCLCNTITLISKESASSD